MRLDTAAAIDIGAERRRLEKDLSAAQADVAQAERKLANPSFVERAPEAVVAKNRDRLAPHRRRSPAWSSAWPPCPADRLGPGSPLLPRLPLPRLPYWPGSPDGRSPPWGRFLRRCGEFDSCITRIRMRN